ncbi:nucleoside triphosphate pyrophosphohydrolase family protein [Tychonema sp. LEGE 07203]|uniref:nucleoside triphosphate pyrophosphohydrolase family protein n=1 Tax=Tychonema sp. LEGE 07203 TaxID=1828671 RepID=UPI00187E8BD3|nr:nucleoside triphosphate pyrophosphohydrolase family protein [Tychonema sp. LEGE 07203]MBE9095042.1 nucleoside triphosphate pyrophosphohydrolase family protein [Tychonema sp. LEGE 07203]
MDFREYQEQALKTDRVPTKSGDGIIVPLLGLVGEAGSLLTEYKKHLRDGDAHKLFKDAIAEELGDLLWYVANVASKFDLDLEKIAKVNIEKCRARWGWRDSVQTGVSATGYIFDREFPENECLPRQFIVEITEFNQDNSVKMRAFIDGQQIGNDLSDNSYSSDGYRFHDIFHLSYVAVLGWSPVIRSNLKLKRKSNPRIDEVEDGGRAIAIEEGVSALVFSYAKDHNFLEGVAALDYQLLKTIKNMSSHLEVARCSLGDWEKAILAGYEVWRKVEKYRGGTVVVDSDTHSITYAQK